MLLGLTQLAREHPRSPGFSQVSRPGRLRALGSGLFSLLNLRRLLLPFPSWLVPPCLWMAPPFSQCEDIGELTFFLMT